MSLYCFVVEIEDLALHFRDLAVCHEFETIVYRDNLMQFD